MKPVSEIRIMLDYHWFYCCFAGVGYVLSSTLSLAGVRVKRGGAEKPRRRIVWELPQAGK